MNRNKFFLLTCAAVVIGLFFYLDLMRYLTLAALKENRQLLLDYYVGHKSTMAVGFMITYILQTALSLPGAAVLSLAAGVIFGPVLGTLYAVSAASIGATLAFLVTRYLLQDIVLQRFGHRLSGINNELEQQGLSYLLFLRLVPLFPFFLVNLACGLTKLPLRTFLFGTVIGIIPGGFVFVNAGASLATVNSLGEIASPRVLASFALLGLFALLPVLYSKYKGRHN